MNEEEKLISEAFMPLLTVDELYMEVQSQSPQVRESDRLDTYAHCETSPPRSMQSVSKQAIVFTIESYIQCLPTAWSHDISLQRKTPQFDAAHKQMHPRKEKLRYSFPC